MDNHRGVWIDIETPSGTLVGDGPLTTFDTLSYNETLNAPGPFSFSVPLSDLRARNIRPRRMARIWTWLSGSPCQLGYGTIITTAYDIQPERKVVTVSGENILGELTYRSVYDLRLYEPLVYTASKVENIWTHSGGGNTDMTLAYDNNISTCNTILLTKADPAPEEWLYVSSTSMFTAVSISLGSACNTNTGSMFGQYLNANVNPPDGSWEFLEISYDGTMTSSCQPFGQTGSILLLPPAYWTITPTTSYFQARFYVTSNNTTDIDVAEVKIGAETMTDTPLADLRNTEAWGDLSSDLGWAFANSAASSAYTEAACGVYMRFDNDTFLTALQRVADSSGEYFAHATNGSKSDRDIIWYRHDSPSTVSYAGNIDNANSPWTHNIISIARTEDGQSLYTRIIPFGGGSGSARLNLLTGSPTFTLPSGYYYSPSSKSIDRNSACTALGYNIEMMLIWPDIVPLNITDNAFIAGGNELAKRAYAWLALHSASSYTQSTFDTSTCPFSGWHDSEVPTTYDIAVEGPVYEARPGQTIRVNHFAAGSGSPTFRVSDILRITSKTLNVDAAGNITTSLHLENRPYTDKTLADIINRYERRGVNEFAFPSAQDAYSSTRLDPPVRMLIDHGRVAGLSYQTDATTGSFGGMATATITVTNGLITSVT